ncbi:hypothetical protein PGIGA_G00094800 [Pangasianodon gigas]|uniref:Uncharacterized protein n=1 Tax=Pangasianodon gigas TaxID=30993 RepID=A0ACC5XCS8_PANGG|nr:hypothetical protein [Pangasianodon gigas]
MLCILWDLFKITASKIFCLQDFSSSGFLDLTFASFTDCSRSSACDFSSSDFLAITFAFFKDCSAFFDQCSWQAEVEVFCGLCLVPLFDMDKVPVTVHLYNPFVAEEDFEAFLGRYCSLVSAEERMLGRFGI